MYDMMLTSPCLAPSAGWATRRTPASPSTSSCAPPGPAACPLRSLAIADRVVRLRVPPPNYLRHFHIREAHAAAVCQVPSATGDEYHALLQAEFSRLQDAQAWYWDQLWPGGFALARAVLEAPEVVRQQQGLELGTGLGVLATCVALAGAASVVASDVEPKALAFAAGPETTIFRIRTADNSNMNVNSSRRQLFF